MKVTPKEIPDWESTEDCSDDGDGGVRSKTDWTRFSKLWLSVAAIAWERYQKWRKLTSVERFNRYCSDRAIDAHESSMDDGLVVRLARGGDHTSQQVEKAKEKLRKTRWLRRLAFARS